MLAADRGVSHPARSWILAATMGAILVSSVLPNAAEARGPQGQPLSLKQVERLIQLQTPDSTVAAEIGRRGLDFAPTKETADSLRRLGAGPATLDSMDQFRPMLDEAKQEIPGILKQIYQALDQGNPQQIRPLLDAGLAGDSSKLDAICKPFTYRAHYIEAILERPGRTFEARVHVLFQPLDERAYGLSFGLLHGKFLLLDVGDAPEDWFGPRFKAAEEESRRLVYALNAGRQELVYEIASPSLIQQGVPDVSLKGRRIGKVETNERTRLFSYRGLKVIVNLRISDERSIGLTGGSLSLLFEPARQPLQLVAWANGSGSFRSRWTEDQGLEGSTLRRFGLPAPTTSELSPTAARPTAAGAPPQKEDAPEGAVQRIRVGGRAQVTKLINAPAPDYPPLAKQARVQGTVRSTVLIGTDGRVRNVQVDSGHRLLVAAAVEAVKNYTYQPTLLNGKPVEVVTEVDVNFTLP